MTAPAPDQVLERGPQARRVVPALAGGDHRHRAAERARPRRDRARVAQAPREHLRRATPRSNEQLRAVRRRQHQPGSRGNLRERRRRDASSCSPTRPRRVRRARRRTPAARPSSGNGRTAAPRAQHATDTQVVKRSTSTITNTRVCLERARAARARPTRSGRRTATDS